MDPETGKFSQTAKLTAKWPTQPAAVYLYSANATTVLLALDFDTSRGDAAGVERDLRTAETWLTSCGAASSPTTPTTAAATCSAPSQSAPPPHSPRSPP